MTRYKAITHEDCSSDWQEALGNPGIRRVLAQLSCRFRLLIWEIRVEDAPGQVPGLPFIANDIAPRPPGGADAAIANLHHPNRGPSPIRAKTYGKEPLQPSIWANYIDKKGGIGGTLRDIAQNYGVQLAVGAMFADEPAYCAQGTGVRSGGSTLRQIPRPGAIEGVKRASSHQAGQPLDIAPNTLP